MQEAPIPENDEARLKSLQSLNILDTDPEERFDRITRIARKLLDVEIVLVSLVDKERQWFKSAVGLDAKETPRNISFCGHAILEDKLFIVTDAKNDERFADNPLVTSDPNISFYAGKPLLGPDAQKMGTLCAISSKARVLTEEEKQILEDLGKWVELELNVKELGTMLEQRKVDLDALAGKNKELERLNEVMVNRELKMVELKKEIKQLQEKISS